MELKKIRVLAETLRKELKGVTNQKIYDACKQLISDLDGYCGYIGDARRLLGADTGDLLKRKLKLILQDLQIFSDLLKGDPDAKSLSEKVGAQTEEVKQLLKIHRLILSEACNKRENRKMSIAEMAARFWGRMHGFRKIPCMLIKDLATYQIAQGRGYAIPSGLLRGRFDQFDRFEKRRRIDCILTGGSEPIIIHSSNENELPGRLMELASKSAALKQLAANLTPKDSLALSTTMERYIRSVEKALASGLTSETRDEINQSLTAVQAALKRIADEARKRIAGYQAAGGRSRAEIKSPTDDDIRHFLSVQGSYLDRLIREEGLLLDKAGEFGRLTTEVLEILESYYPAKKTLELKLKGIDRKMNDFHGAQLELSHEIGYWGYNPLFWLTQKITDFRDTVQYMLQSDDFSQKTKDGLWNQVNGICKLYDQYTAFHNSEIKKNPELELSVHFAQISRTAEELKALVYDTASAMCDHQPTATPVNYLKLSSAGAGLGKTQISVCGTGAPSKVQK